MPIPKKLNKDFFKKWSPGMAYLLGYFAADGTMITNPRGAYYIEFHSTDKQLLLITRRLLESDHKISIRKKRKETHKLGYRIQIGSKDMFQDLTQLGFTPNKSLTIALLDMPKGVFRDFVRGYFDGDGCVYFKRHKAKDRKRKRWIFTARFTSGSKNFLQSLHLRLNLEGGFITKKERGWELVFSHRDSLALYNLMYHNNSHGLYLKRKYKLFSRAVRILFGNNAVVV